MSQGHFFAVDRRDWARACDVGLNAAVAYLVLARGTLRDMRTTSWSVNAIEERTSIARHRAALAIKALVDAGLVRQDRGGSRPRYFLLPFGMDGDAPDWIWLPNALVDGAGDETPPVELVRQSQNPAALRLLVELYHAHGLARDGGIHWRQLRMQFQRVRVAQTGAYVIWGFREGTKTSWTDAPFVRPFLTGKMEKTGDGHQRDKGWPAFWAALSVLETTRLVEYVGHVIDADTSEGEVVHPYAVGNGEPGELAIANWAHAAGQSLLPDHLLTYATDEALALLPARPHQVQIQVVGIPRLRYRPRTAATLAWHSSADEWAAWVDRYRRIRAEITEDFSGLQHQRDING